MSDNIKSFGGALLRQAQMKEWKAIPEAERPTWEQFKRGLKKKKKWDLKVDFFQKSDKIISVIRTYTLYWKDEDTNRVRSEEFSNKTGWDHSAMDAALEMAEEADANLFPWLLEEDGFVVAFGRGGERLGSAIRFA